MQTKLAARQWPLSFFQPLDKSNLGAGNEVLIVIPPGGYLLDIAVFVETAYDAGTTATVTASDGTTTFINAQTVKATGPVTVAVGKKYFPNGGTITVSMAQTGTADTVGKAYVSGSYLGANRETEQQF